MTQQEIEQAFNGRWRMKCYILENIDGKAAKEIARDFFEAGLALGAREYVPLEQLKMNMETPLIKTKNDQKLFDRSIPFNQSVFNTENIQKYGQQMLQDFYDYWTEPNPSHTKMRFELQKTWDVNRRLARWARNNFNKYGNNKPTPNEQQSKLADILVG